MQIQADKLDYNKETQEITASGNIASTKNDATITSGKVVAKPEEKKVEQSPHAEAIQLVMTTQMDEIRKIDGNDWLFDVKARCWEAKRLFYPGLIDSTHTFQVTYRIDGQLAQSWMVDTRKKTVEIEKAKTAGGK